MDVTINGGDIRAIGGQGAAGIGSGYESDASSDDNVKSITITGGVISVAFSCDLFSGAYSGPQPTGAAIGGGDGGNSGVIRIDRGVVLKTLHGYDNDGDGVPIGSGSGGAPTAGVQSNVTFGSFSGPQARTMPERPYITVYEDLPLVKSPETLTITQGDGRSANVTLYANDTLYDIAKKINGAIADGLGQKRYVDDASKFCTVADGTPLTSESVFKSILSDDEEEEVSYYATMLVRSAVAGRAGELSFSGSEELLNTLGLNTIQEARENQFTVNVTDAHSGASVASNVQVTGNRLAGIIHPNVDVEFDAMAGVTAKWDNKNRRFNYTAEAYSTTLHLSDNTTVLQVGANEGEDLAIHVGDMSAHALGLDEVNVMNREAAARSITVIDNAIDRVSVQRSKLGAYQNRLEHAVNNIAAMEENQRTARSRIRNENSAKATIEFTKFLIKGQAARSIVAQANQLPQNVLRLL